MRQVFLLLAYRSPPSIFLANVTHVLPSRQHLWPQRFYWNTSNRWSSLDYEFPWGNQNDL